MRYPLRAAIIGLLLLSVLAGCTHRHGFATESTRERLARQYEFESKYLDNEG